MSPVGWELGGSTNAAAESLLVASNGACAKYMRNIYGLTPLSSYQLFGQAIGI
jgi:hypothetical protein